MSSGPTNHANTHVTEHIDVAIIGAGPAGLMAADRLAAHGVRSTVFDQMPSVARKLLIAGRGGLNLTHSEPLEKFLSRYVPASPLLSAALQSFKPHDLRAWVEALGEPTFVGSSGRVFPKSLKASPLLRAWLKRLVSHDVSIRTRNTWQGWDTSGHLKITHPGGEVTVSTGHIILALGGASWPKLGSNAKWQTALEARGIKLSPFKPSNCGFTVSWTEHFRNKFQGAPLKSIALRHKQHSVIGEALVTRTGLEGGAIYALSAALRYSIEQEGCAELTIDLKPNESAQDLARKLARPRGADSWSNFLRKAVSLPPVAIALLREQQTTPLPDDPLKLAEAIKSVSLRLTGHNGLERAISSAGGLCLSELTDEFELKQLPGVFAVGEMLDWEAPTGGYLLQACFSTAVTAADAIGRRLHARAGAG